MEIRKSESTCHACQHPNRAENRFCTSCGVRLRSADDGVARLVLLREGEETVFCLSSGDNIIGRDIMSKVMLEDAQISKKHANIHVSDDTCWIEDLQSKNGVFVNGKRVSGRQTLQPGSLIKLGASLLRFEMAHVTAFS